MRPKVCVVSISFLFFMVIISAVPVSAQGKVEISFHFGSWSLNILKDAIEEGLGDNLETEFKDSFQESIQSDYPGLQALYYDQTVEFDSSGQNFGFELRWYPRGQNGSFSLGLAVERTTMEVGFPNVSAELGLSDGSVFQANASGRFLIKPLAFLMSFRWDMWPSARLHPYLTFGVGGAAMGPILDKGEFSFAYEGTLDVSGGGQDYYSESDTKTLREFKDEIEAEGEDDFVLPGFLPFLQLHVGLKAVVSRNIHIMVDAGILNGILIRGGLAFRF